MAELGRCNGSLAKVYSLLNNSDGAESCSSTSKTKECISECCGSIHSRVVVTRKTFALLVCPRIRKPWHRSHRHVYVVCTLDDTLRVLCCKVPLSSQSVKQPMTPRYTPIVPLVFHPPRQQAKQNRSTPKEVMHNQSRAGKASTAAIVATHACQLRKSALGDSAVAA